MAYHVEMMTVSSTSSEKKARFPVKEREYTGRWLLIVMLVLLHGALWLGISSIWSRPLLLAHLGVFLMWQPLWRGQQVLRWGSATFILAASVVAVWWLNWWVLAFWVSGLFALVGGRVFLTESALQRWRYLLMMAYFLSMLLLWIVPQLFALPGLIETLHGMVGIAFPILLLVIALIPDQRQTAKLSQIHLASGRLAQPAQTSAVDFFYSLMLFMLVILLVLGSLAFMTLAGNDYFGALLRTLMAAALALFILSWLWNPRLGFSGLQPILSRYLLNIGSPFEVWLNQLAETAHNETSPAIFLTRAIEHLSALPWLSGLNWVSDEGSGQFGTFSPHQIEIIEQDLHLTLFSRNEIAPSVMLHMKLLTGLLGHFYQAKRHEQRLRDIARLQAIYETGSRLTHDLKNMLQSLLALISIAQHQAPEAVPLLRRQLPVLAQRIEMVLAKLRTPQSETDTNLLPLVDWWENLRARYPDAALMWAHDGAAKGESARDSDTSTMLIPEAIFDCVADNLINNAFNKKQCEPETVIRISLREKPFSFSVCDNGSRLPEPLAHQVLRMVVVSEDGFGVGLYQAARWAEQAGYNLVMRNNITGNVCFELSHSARADVQG